jgi:adenylate cyclase 10
VVEILEVNEYNVFYRFVNTFLRETIYQKMTFKQRRHLHRLVAQTIQDVPSEFDDKYAGLKLQYHWILSEKLNDETTSLKFSHKAKRSMIVKQIQ